MILTWLRKQQNETEDALLRAVARRDHKTADLLTDKLVNLVDEIGRLESYTVEHVDE